MRPSGQSIQSPGGSDAAIAARGNAAFAVDLYHILAAESGNLCFSPYSISTALAMTYAGARGETARQMAQALHFTLEEARLHPAFAELEAGLKASQDKGDVLMQIANKLWPQVGYPFLETFLALTEAYFGVAITPLDYGDPEAARLTINAWVEEKTQEKIKDLIAPGLLDPMTTLVLVNAIYFKGAWHEPFHEASTAPAPFHLASGETVEAPTMAGSLVHGRHAQGDGWMAFSMAYEGGNLEMVVILPDGDLADVESELTAAQLAEMLDALEARYLILRLPRFKFEVTLPLEQGLFIVLHIAKRKWGVFFRS